MTEYASLVCVITHSCSLSAVLAVTNAQTQPDRLYMHANTVSCLVPDVITVLVFRADADKLLIVINSRINYPPLSSLLVATVYYRSVTHTVDHQISALGLNIMCFPLCIGGTSRFIVQTVAFCQCQLNVFIFSIHWLSQNEDWCWIASHWIPRVTLVLSSAHIETHTVSSRLKTHRLPVCPTNITKQGDCSHCNENQLLYESTVCGQMKSRGSFCSGLSVFCHADYCPAEPIML